MGADAPPVYPRQTKSLMYFITQDRHPPKHLNEEFVSLTGSHISSITRVTLHISPFFTPSCVHPFQEMLTKVLSTSEGTRGTGTDAKCFSFFLFLFKDFFTSCAFELSLIERKD